MEAGPRHRAGGRNQLVATVAKVYRPGQIILASDYGVAGAIPAYGLPNAHSGHWYLGPPPGRDAPVLAIRTPREDRRRYWTDVRAVAMIDNGLKVSNEEQGRRIRLCRGQRLPWSRLWPWLLDLS